MESVPPSSIASEDESINLMGWKNVPTSREPHKVSTITSPIKKEEPILAFGWSSGEMWQVNIPKNDEIMRFEWETNLWMLIFQQAMLDYRKLIEAMIAGDCRSLFQSLMMGIVHIPRR